MADEGLKKRLCPECEKEIDATLDECDLCAFPVAGYDGRRRIEAVLEKECKVAADKKAKEDADARKKKGKGIIKTLSQL